MNIFQDRYLTLEQDLISELKDKVCVFADDETIELARDEDDDAQTHIYELPSTWQVEHEYHHVPIYITEISNGTVYGIGMGENTDSTFEAELSELTVMELLQIYNCLQSFSK